MRVGQLAGIYRFPVKSMLGEQVRQCYVEPFGIPGDRSHALIDSETGKIASAKNPTLWQGLLKMSARIENGAVVVEFPDGRKMTVDEADFETAISTQLGRDVTLASSRNRDFALDRADPEEFVAKSPASDVTTEPLVIGAEAQGNAFVDFAPIHIVAKSTMRAVAEASGMNDMEEIRYRPNIVINDEAPAPFCENGWIGRTLSIGELRLVVDHATPRCAIPTLQHGRLSPAKSIVRTLVERNRQEFLDKGRLPCLGVYAKIISPATICKGDAVIAT